MEYLVLGKAGEQDLIAPLCGGAGWNGFPNPCPWHGGCTGFNFRPCPYVALEPWGIPIEP